MSKAGQTLKRSPLATAGAILLILFYGAALFANFLGPYSADSEFRDHFFHPPSVIHFRNADGQFVTPYVAQTYLVDSRKHLFQEGSPLWVGRVRHEMNKNPYIAESIETEEPFAIIKNSRNEILRTIMTAKETGENTGLFAGFTTIDPNRTGKEFVVESDGKKRAFVFHNDQYVAPSDHSEILLLNRSGGTITFYKPSAEMFKLRLFTRGANYKLFGIFETDIHLIGVDLPGHLFLMGTDQAGRDIFSRVLEGSRVSLTVGLIGVLISTILGMWIGAIAGYFGGRTDSWLMRGADVVLSIPALYFILSVRNAFPVDLASEVTFALVIVVLSLTGWAAMARVIRGMVLSLREQEYVLAARSLGASSGRILLRHILPNTLGYVIVRATLLIPAYILAEVTLSYLGIGIQEPAASWGNMLSAAQELRVLEQFTWILAPGVFLFLTVLGFNFLGDGLQDLQAVRETQTHNG